MKTCGEHPEASVYGALRTMVDWRCGGPEPGCGVVSRLEAEPPPAPCPHCKSDFKPEAPQQLQDVKCSLCHRRVGVAAVTH